MKEILIKEIQKNFIKSNQRLFFRSWLAVSSFIFLYSHFTSLASTNIYLNINASIFTGLLVAFNILLINAAFDVMNFYALKMKFENNEHINVRVIKNKGRLARCLNFFTNFDKVRVYEINGKKLKRPIRASLDHKFKEEQITGCLIKIPTGYFYIPDSIQEDIEHKHVA